MIQTKEKPSEQAKNERQGLKAPPRRYGVRTIISETPWAVFALIIFVLICWPIIMLVFGSFRTAPPGAGGTFSIDGFTDGYSKPENYISLLNSAILAISTVIIGLSIALLLLTVSMKSKLLTRRVVTPAMLLILGIPSIFYGVSYAMLGNPRGSVLTFLISPDLGGVWAALNTTSWVGMIIVCSFKAAAYGYLLLLGPFRALSGSLEEAAQVSGAGWWRVLTRIAIPMLRPALLGVAILTFAIGLEAFEVPLVLGLPVGIRVFSTQIFGLIGSNFPPDYAGASALSLLFVTVILILVPLAQRSLADRSFVTVDAKGRAATPWKFGKARGPLNAFVILFVVVAAVLPLVQIVVGSLQSYFGVWGPPTIKHYVSVLNNTSLVSSLQTTALIAVVGGLATMVLATVISYVQARGVNRRRAKAVGIIAWIPLGLPGIVLGVGLLWAYISVPGLNLIYGTPWLMLLGLIVVGIPIGTKPMDGAIAQVSTDLESAARISGAPRLIAIIRTVFPLILPSFIAGWFIVAIFLSGNLDVPILLSSSSSQPATLTAYNLYLDANTAKASALLCILFGGSGIILGIPALAMWLFNKRANKRRQTVATPETIARSSTALPVVTGGAQLSDIAITRTEMKGTE